MKKLYSILILSLSCLLVISLSFSAFAAQPRLSDKAGLLSYTEQQNLESKLDELSEELGVDIAVVTVDDMSDEGFYDIMEFADYYAESNLSENSVVLAISMADRDYCISTQGICIDYITDAGISRLEDGFLPFLSGGEYYYAFEEFADDSAELIKSGQNGDVYDEWIYDDDNAYDDYAEDEGFKPLTAAVISIVIGLIAGAIVVSVLKGQLKSVSKENYASNYAVSNSLNLLSQNDTFLYSSVAAVPRPKDTDNSTRSSGGGHMGGSSTHVSPGGVTHGGRGGKF